MNRFKIPDDQPMEAKILSNQIENAQKKVEEQNFVARKNVLKYDDVMNTQRMVIYEQRRRVLEGDDLSAEVRGWITETVENSVRQLTDAEFAEDWDLDGLVASLQSLYGTDITVHELREEVDVTDRDALVEEFVDDALETYDEREQALGSELAREVERYVILQTVDQRWREHLEAMDYLREGVHLRAFAQKDPLVEYRGEGHAMFEELGGAIRQEVVFTLFHVAVRVEEPPSRRCRQRAASSTTSTRRPPVRTRSPPPGAPRRRSPTPSPPRGAVRPGAGGQRAQGHRPQRPVLVRVRGRSTSAATALRGRDQLPTRSSTGIREMSRTAVLVSLLVAGSAAFGLLALGYDDDPLGPLDRDVAEWVASDLRGWVEWLARPFSWLGGWIGLTALGVAAGVLLVRQRAWLDLAFFLTAFLGSQLVVAFLKDWFDRPRPDVGPAVPLPESAAFPSGHATAGVASLGALAVLASERLPSRRARTWLWSAVVVGGLVVGLSRVALGVHYVTDVLAGWALGLAWLAACLIVRDLVRR